MKAAQLVSIPIFDLLTDAERERIADVSRLALIDPGETIVTEGDLSFDLFVIESGTAEVRRGDEVVAELGPGEFFGEMGVLPRRGLRWGRRGATVVATSSMVAIALAGHEARSLIEEIPSFGEAIVASAAARERAAQPD
jgi:CRP-like cAMP-binding protein